MVLIRLTQQGTNLEFVRTAILLVGGAGGQ